MTAFFHMDLPLFRDDFNPEFKPYPVRIPDIKSGAAYYFETDSGLRYQVLFAKKKNSYLENIVNFSVLNEEFEDEYSETNRGEIYRVIATVVEIIRIYHKNHAYSTSYEFSGEFKKGNENRKTSIRTLLYLRKAREIMHPSWEIEMEGNRVIVHQKKRKR
ncbi:MAG: hypothetical protein KAR19_06020 [Bacteroidales bacterium]|nr:hypothetical protein [Bacteroidales bacterium]